MTLGEEAVGRDPLSIADGSSDPSEEEDISMLDLAGLQAHVWHVQKRQSKHTGNTIVSG